MPNFKALKNKLVRVYGPIFGGHSYCHFVIFFEKFKNLTQLFLDIQPLNICAKFKDSRLNSIESGIIPQIYKEYKMKNLERAKTQKKKLTFEKKIVFN